MESLDDSVSMGRFKGGRGGPDLLENHVAIAYDPLVIHVLV